MKSFENWVAEKKLKEGFDPKNNSEQMRQLFQAASRGMADLSDFIYYSGDKRAMALFNNFCVNIGKYLPGLSRDPINHFNDYPGHTHSPGSDDSHYYVHPRDKTQNKKPVSLINP